MNDQTNEQHPNPVMRWKNRRRMAWCATIGGLSFPLIGLAVDDASFLGQIAPSFYFFTGAIVGAYIGFATIDKGK